MNLVSRSDQAFIAAIYGAAVAGSGCFLAVNALIDTPHATPIAVAWLALATLLTWLCFFRPVSWNARAALAPAFIAVALAAIPAITWVWPAEGADISSATRYLSDVLLLVIALVVAGAIAGFTAVILRPAGRQPRRGQFWMATVPFEDGSGSKDRPCLVVGGTARSLRVLYVTSQDKDANRHYIRLPHLNWTGAVGRKASWMRVTDPRDTDPTIVVSRRDFRRPLGRWDRSVASVVKQQRIS